jgi:pimeloyl-ACP methyl ester carboxylesterase
MVSLWGSKKDDDNVADQPRYANNGEAHGEPAPRVSEADERTRLLPPPARHDGFLSPDDPAVSNHSRVSRTELIYKPQVSPYNLWSVRFLRYFTVFFLIISFLWWVLLLVSIFISPPGMHSRGSGFFDFSYTTLTTATLLIVLLFFATPSKAAQVTCLVIAVLLLVDMILIVAVPKVRSEEGWVGITSVVWALLMSIYVVFTDRVVAWGKEEEEERLTGRVETRRTVKEWFSVLASTIVLIVIAVVVALLTATLILRSRDASLAPPGERYYVDGDKYQVHIFCEGNETDKNGQKVPTVLFEAGEKPFEGEMLEVAMNAMKNGTIERYCYYDRPGFGWSDNAPSPFSAASAADVLAEALARAGETGPWVLASSGVGSIYSRIFSSMYGGTQVLGLLLIDPLHEDLLYRLSSPRRGFFLWARGVISPLGLDRLSGALFRGRNREDRIYGRSAYQGGKYIKAKLQESLVADSLTKNEVIRARTIQDAETPFALISSGIEVRRDSTWESKQRDLSKLTNKCISWDIVNKAPHEVWRTLDGRDVIEKRLGELVQG